MSNNYEKLFEELKEFKQEQEKQKQRGLNNYNILTTVLSESDEVRLHSRMIASLLDPQGEHYQSNLFLDKFLETLNIPDFKIDSFNSTVYREYQNIDIYITDGKRHIIIENKVYAGDQDKQIERYIKVLEQENENLEVVDTLVIYLSLDRLEPSRKSLGSLSVCNHKVQRDIEDIALYRSIYYKNEILEWLKKCKYEVQNITNLNEVFRQYIDVVKMINNQYEEKIMSLMSYIKENEEIYKLAVELAKELPASRKNIVDNFFENLATSLRKELGDEWIVEIVGKLEKKYNGNLSIYKKSWDKKSAGLRFAFEFAENDYYDGYFGITRNTKNVDIKHGIMKEFSQKLSSLNTPIDTTTWWLHSEWLPDFPGTVDFPAYIQFNEKNNDIDAKEEVFNKIMRLIKRFELNSNLISEINEYLNRTN